ncbi:MAG: hypothetical protein LBR25_09390 [Erysipelotrichaceae bacterium]|jgi:hypothetical protein|nr:hypothetical protein [Erysipelotrichaceae bacterium]
MKLTIRCEDKERDYQVPKQMVIKEFLDFLYRHDHFPPSDKLESSIYSKRQRLRISTALTFIQAEIYAGDILEVYLL